MTTAATDGAPGGSVAVSPFTGDAAEWDAFVREQPEWTHFHGYGWRSIMQRVFGHESPYLCARDREARLAGILPLVWVKSRLFGRYLVSLPFLNYGGPLGSELAVRALVDAASQEAQRGRALLLELRSAHELPTELPRSDRKITVRLSLAADEEAMWSRLASKVRSQIRRPTKDGYIARTGLEELEAFYTVFAHHMRDLGTPVLPRSFFSEIVSTFRDSVRIATAYLGQVPVAAAFGFRWADRFELTWASALLAHKKAAPNMLVYWELIRNCVREGVTEFDFGRCTPGSGTHRFKRQWGGVDAPLYWYQRADRPDTHTPSPDDSAYAWGPRLWRHLPVRVATLLGPRIVRFIP